MGWIYERYVRPALFSIDPEKAHLLALQAAGTVQKFPVALKAIAASCQVNDPRLNIRLGNLVFPNPLGLAAGMDKNGVAPGLWAALGFGSMEIGSVSADPSEGNAVRPRLFRLPEDESIVVYYGVPNEGAEIISARLKNIHLKPTPSSSSQLVTAKLGINFVETHRSDSKSSGIPEESLGQEITRAMKSCLGAQADFWTLNANCPNTGSGASSLTRPQAMVDLLSLMESELGPHRIPPLFLKLTIETDPDKVQKWIESVRPFSFVAGFSFNLPPGIPYRLKTPKSVYGCLPGTLTGPPIRDRINQGLSIWSSLLTDTRFHLMVAGGVNSAETLYEKILLGAPVVQAYTGLVYQGPGMIRDTLLGLLKLIERDGFKNVQDAVGARLRACPSGTTDRGKC